LSTTAVTVFRGDSWSASIGIQ